MPTARRSSADCARPRGLAINVGANTNLPGIRGRLFADGRFEYIPIPERARTARPVPTYADLGVRVPAGLEDVQVHLDPEFAEYPCGTNYTYGDEYAVKAGPLSTLSRSDYVWFYATLEPEVDAPACAPPDWGAFLIGQFRLAIEPLTSPSLDELELAVRERCATNAHFARDPPDARVVVIGDPTESGLFQRAIPLSAPAGGTEPGALVTDLSDDSGRGPWWRRPLRFDAEATERLAARIDRVAW